jgi:hypothetical protein
VRESERQRVCWYIILERERSESEMKGGGRDILWSAKRAKEGVKEE